MKKSDSKPAEKKLSEPEKKGSEVKQAEEKTAEKKPEEVAKTKTLNLPVKIDFDLIHRRLKRLSNANSFR